MSTTTTAPTLSPLATLKAAETGLAQTIHMAADHIRRHVATSDLSDALAHLQAEAEEATQRLRHAKALAAGIVSEVLAAIRHEAHDVLQDLQCWDIDREELVVLPMPAPAAPPAPVVVAQAACSPVADGLARAAASAQAQVGRYREVRDAAGDDVIDLAALPDDARDAVRERAAAETVTPPAPTPEAKADLDEQNNGGESVPMEAPASAPDLPSPDVASASAPVSAPVPPAPAKPKGRKKGGR